MHDILHFLLHVLSHSVLDTLKLIPFLFLSYLLMEFLEHKAADHAQRCLYRSGRIGPLLGGALGILPQCGFSAAASGLYTGRIITTGTLIAVYLSTSDEMLPILISEGAPLVLIVKLLTSKLVVGILAGFVVDLITSILRKHGRGKDPEPQIEALCERENCSCGNHFLLSALKHTAHISLFILLITLFLTAGIEILGENRLASFLASRPLLGNLLAAPIGLIPNCASSVVLTELYLSGVLSTGALLAGLLVNAGVGLAILFRNNRPVSDSLRILLILFGIGIAVGVAVDLTPLATWIAG